jgi:LmbE family N-acetylglucosaminyl deacetylase
MRGAKPTILIFLVLIAIGSVKAFGRVNTRQRPSKTILAIFAHPDDEVSIGPLLTHYAKRGVRVYLAVVTSGQQGVNSFAKIPAGDQLGGVREAESREACQAYGISEPFLLQEQDGTLSTMRRHDEIVDRLAQIIRQIRPSVIVTWGPDGLTGHPDHRAVSNLVTEVFQNSDELWKKGESPQKLYYVVFPKSKSSNLPKSFKNVSDSYITTIVHASDGLNAAAKAEESYRSQHTPEDMKFWNETMAKLLNGNIYLRLALSRIRRSTQHETDVFTGIR